MVMRMREVSSLVEGGNDRKERIKVCLGEHVQNGNM